MEQQILHDKDQYPTDVIIFSHIGEAKNKWEKLFNLIWSVLNLLSLIWT